MRSSARWEKWSRRWREYVWTVSGDSIARMRTVRRYMCKKVTWDQVEKVGLKPRSRKRGIC